MSIGNVCEVSPGTKLNRSACCILAIILLFSAFAALPMSVEGQVGPAKDKTFYLHNSTVPLNVNSKTTLRYFDTTLNQTPSAGREANSTKDVYNDWYLYPVLAGDLQLSGDVYLFLWAKRDGTNPDARFVFTLYDVSPNGTETEIAATPGGAGETMFSDWREYQMTATITSPYTVIAGHSMRVFFHLLGNAANIYTIVWGNDTFRSRLVLPCMDYVNVDGIQVLDHEGHPQVSLDPMASNKIVTFRGNITDPFGGYDIKWVNASLEGPSGAVFEKVPMTWTKGYFNSFYNEFETSWDYSGFPPGRYNITVFGVDNTGHNYRYPANPGDESFGGHLMSLTTSFWIGGLPNQVMVTVEDNVGQPLEGAKVELGASSGFTGTDGTTTLTGYNGTYGLTVSWQDVVVHEGPAEISGDSVIVVEVDVYYPEFVVVDDQGNPVEDAVIFIEHPNGTLLKDSWRTDRQGVVGLERMAGGDYLLSVLWRGVEVFEGTVTVDGNGPFAITTKIYALTITVVDDRGLGLELAQVVITNSGTGLVTDSTLTDLEGGTSSLLPVGSYDFSVYWRNVLVYDDTVGYTVSNSHSLTLYANIYTVNITVVDSNGFSLANAQVVIGLNDDSMVLDSQLTESDGKMSTRLSEGSYNIRIYWRDNLVNATLNHLVTGNQDLILVADVFWAAVEALDSEGEPVENAQVTFIHPSGQTYASGMSNATGGFMARIPKGTYTIRVTWMETLVFEENISVDTSDPIPLDLDVHYLTVEVIGSDGRGVEHADIKVVRSGLVVASDLTDSEGAVVFRLPEDGYTVDMSFKATYQLTNIDISKSQEIELDSSKTVSFRLSDEDYPIPFYTTNLLLILLCILVLLVALLLVFYLTLRRARSAGSEEPRGVKDQGETETGNDEAPEDKSDSSEKVDPKEINEDAPE